MWLKKARMEAHPVTPGLNQHLNHTVSGSHCKSRSQQTQIVPPPQHAHTKPLPICANKCESELIQVYQVTEAVKAQICGAVFAARLKKYVVKTWWNEDRAAMGIRRSSQIVLVKFRGLVPLKTCGGSLQISTRHSKRSEGRFHMAKWTRVSKVASGGVA